MRNGEIRRGRKRLLVRGMSACYHVMSRTPCGQYLFKDREKEMFVRMMWKQAQFCGLEVISYAVMSNHFHILVRVPYEEEVSDVELLKRYSILYSNDNAPSFALTPTALSDLLKKGGNEADEERQRIRLRMGDLSVFMRELKQRFSIWYNHTHDNQGTIWSNRYKSLLVEDREEVLTVLAAYIDLNAVRAGIVDDPCKYRYCSYSEAMGGSKIAREGLISMYGCSPWRSAISDYRMVLFDKGNKVKTEKNSDDGVINRDRVREVISTHGAVSMKELLRCRVRYFNDGMVLGSEMFVEKIFKEERWRFGEKRRRGGHSLRGVESMDLKVMRDLRKDVIS